MRAPFFTIAITLLASVSVLSAPSTSYAQGDMTIAVSAVEGRDTPGSDELTITPISSSECTGNIDVTLDLRAIDSSSTIIDIWRSTGNDCADETQRGGDTATCISLSETNLDIGGATELLGNVFTIQSLVPCEDGVYTLYFLATDSAMTTGAVTNYGTLDISVDTGGPSPVTDFVAGDGQNSISLSWGLPTDADVDHLEVFAELGTCADTELKMYDMMAAPPGATPINSELTSAQTTYSVDPDDIGMAIGAEAAFGVIAVDTAGNQSLLSVDCAIRVQTEGFCDVYARDTGQPCPDECSVRAPGAGRSGGLLGVAFALAALLVWRRRR